MIRQPASSKVMKQSKTKTTPTSTPTPTPRATPSWGSGERGAVWAARWNAFPAICIGPLREGLDSAVVVIDRMTAGKMWTDDKHFLECQSTHLGCHLGHSPFEVIGADRVPSLRSG